MPCATLDASGRGVSTPDPQLNTRIPENRIPAAEPLPHSDLWRGLRLPTVSPLPTGCVARSPDSRATARMVPRVLPLPLSRLSPWGPRGHHTRSTCSYPRRAQRSARHRKGDTPDMARPTKLTPEVHEQIVGDIEAGNFAVIAATAAGITEQTYYNWLNRGRDDLASDDPEDRESIYAKFFESVKQSEARAEISTLREMNRDDKWQRRAWWLERRFPKRWGQKAALELSGPGGGPMAVASTADALAELETFLDDRKEQIEAAQAAMATAKE